MAITPHEILAATGYRVRAKTNGPRNEGDGWVAYRPDGGRVHVDLYPEGRPSFANAWAAAARDYTENNGAGLSQAVAAARPSLATKAELKEVRVRIAALTERAKVIESRVAAEYESAADDLRKAAGAFSGERNHEPDAVADMVLNQAILRFDAARQAVHDLEAVPLNY